MGLKLNPITGQFDLTGSGGTSVLEGEVALYSDLPITTPDPAVGSAYLVRENSGVWLVNRKPAGIYIRTNNTGVRDSDWSYGGDFPVQSVNGEVGAVTLDASDVGAPPTSRTISAGTGLTGGGDLSANRTLSVSFGSAAGSVCEGNDARLSNARTPTSHAASHAAGQADELFDQSLNEADTPTFGGLTIEGTAVAGQTPDTVMRGGVWFGGSDGTNGVGIYKETSFGGNAVAFTGANEAISAYNNIIFSAAGEPQLYLKTDGNVGIGTSSPNQKLDVAGNLLLRDGYVDEDEQGFSATFDAQENLTANRIYNLPDRSGELALVSDITKSAVGLSNVTNNAQTQAAIVPNTAPSAGQVLVGNAGGTAYAPVAVSGDATLASTGALTLANNSTTRSNLGLAAIASSGSASDLGSGTVPIARLSVGSTAGTIAAGDDSRFHTRSHAITSTSDHTASNWQIFYSNGSGEIVELALGSNGTVLTSNGATSAPSFAAASGGVGGGSGSVDNAIIRADGTGGSTVQSSDISILDASTSTQNNVAITNEHSGQTNSSLVLCNKGTGAFIVSPARPDATSSGGNSRGSSAVCIVPTRNNANQVASGSSSIAIGVNARSASSSTIAIGTGSVASNTDDLSIGNTSQATGNYSIAIGNGGTTATGFVSTAIGRTATASQGDTIAIGRAVTASAVNAVVIGGVSQTSNLRAQFLTLPFSAVYWSGQTTNNTATILNLDGTATNRFTIAASTALAVDILLVARRTGTQDKWLVARRFLGIRRDGSNNTSLIGTVQEVAPDQSSGSPTWTYAFTADDTNEALQCEVTGATGETVEWRVTAFYRVA